MRVGVTYDTVDELDVPGALGVAVTRSVLGTSLVGGEARHATIGVHGGEVESTVETAGELGHVDIEGELLVKELEHLVGAVVLHQEKTGTDVGAGLEAQRQRVAVSLNTVGTRVVSTIQGTVLGASLVVGAESGIPCISSVACTSLYELKALLSLLEEAGCQSDRWLGHVVKFVSEIYVQLV